MIIFEIIRIRINSLPYCSTMWICFKSFIPFDCRPNGIIEIFDILGFFEYYKGVINICWKKWFRSKIFLWFKTVESKKSSFVIFTWTNQMILNICYISYRWYFIHTMNNNWYILWQTEVILFVFCRAAILSPMLHTYSFNSQCRFNNSFWVLYNRIRYYFNGILKKKWVVVVIFIILICLFTKNYAINILLPIKPFLFN